MTEDEYSWRDERHWAQSWKVLAALLLLPAPVFLLEEKLRVSAENHPLLSILQGLRMADGSRVAHSERGGLASPCAKNKRLVRTSGAVLPGGATQFGHRGQCTGSGADYEGFFGGEGHNDVFSTNETLTTEGGRGWLPQK